HVSNLDSVILGYAIYRLGLPPFAYGAGLNLFSNATIGFFMRNLGAYTVDRNKTDPLYKETLKEYACELLEHGQHSLFFPGGTRSRSGAVESRLKKGLLGSAPRAFRRALERGSARPKIFIVPCTLTYPLVLEASTLVGDFLRAEGGAHYIDVHDESDRPRQWAEFIRGLLALDLRIHVHVGGALDPIGNTVDAEGESMDPRGRRIDASRYFLADGQLVEDDARDAEYTRLLESRLIDSYRHDTVALPSSVLARAVFDRLRRTQRQPDLFRFLRGLEIDPWVPADEVERDVALLQAEMVELSRSKEIRVAPELLRARPESLIASALATFATYHAVPVIERQGARLRVGDPNLLYYYASRLFHVAARPT
ncbi:MAG: 1-acyl-sn-glycerol-3-phosphate acyltransferase, partial [Polyangiaceae bacterium]